jgi:hypothetical protein
MIATSFINYVAGIWLGDFSGCTLAFISCLFPLTFLWLPRGESDKARRDVVLLGVLFLIPVYFRLLSNLPPKIDWLPPYWGLLSYPFLGGDFSSLDLTSLSDRHDAVLRSSVLVVVLTFGYGYFPLLLLVGSLLTRISLAVLSFILYLALNDTAKERLPEGNPATDVGTILNTNFFTAFSAFEGICFSDPQGRPSPTPRRPRGAGEQSQTTMTSRLPVQFQDAKQTA